MLLQKPSNNNNINKNRIMACHGEHRKVATTANNTSMPQKYCNKKKIPKTHTKKNKQKVSEKKKLYRKKKKEKFS